MPQPEALWTFYMKLREFYFQQKLDNTYQHNTDVTAT